MATASNTPRPTTRKASTATKATKSAAPVPARTTKATATKASPRKATAGRNAATIVLPLLKETKNNVRYGHPWDSERAVNITVYVALETFGGDAPPEEITVTIETIES